MSSTKLINTFKSKVILQNTLLRTGFAQLRNSSSLKTEDVETHTGQKFDKDDYRLARFINAPKHVNKNFAICLIDQIPPKVVKERVVYCDGGDEHLGHPRVYINLDKPGNHTCGYCGLRFVLDNKH